MRRGVSQGGSTITQQLAKNLFLTQERTFGRKLQELVLALWLERKFTKTEILELYLNRVYFGAGAYGVDAAAQRYFGKSARQVTIAEAAMLAGLVRSPSRLAPNRNPERRRAARPDRDRGDDRPRLRHRDDGEVRAGAARARREGRRHRLRQLHRRLDHGRARRPGRPYRPGYRGRAPRSIPACRRAAETALVDELAQKGEKLGVSQGALIAMTPTGAVRALVGGKNYAESQFNRAVAAKRQPGSAFKPFVYLTALERGLAPESMREDKPIAIKGWRPENYSREYYGPVTLTQGLAHSLNTVSVRLTLEFGADRRRPDRLSPRHRIQARGQSFAGARHIGGFADRAGLGLCAVRQWRQRDRALCGRAREHQGRQDALPCARRTTSGGSSSRATSR